MIACLNQWSTLFFINNEKMVVVYWIPNNCCYDEIYTLFLEGNTIRDVIWIIDTGLFYVLSSLIFLTTRALKITIVGKIHDNNAYITTWMLMIVQITRNNIKLTDV